MKLNVVEANSDPVTLIEVEGEPIAIPGFEAFEFFHNEDPFRSMINITEYTTGASVGWGLTIGDAKECAIENLKKSGVGGLRRRVNNMLKKLGKPSNVQEKTIAA